MQQKEHSPTPAGPRPDYSYGYGYGQDASGGDDFSLAQLIGVLRRHIRLICICAAIGALAAAEWALRKPPVYTATVELLVDGQANAFLEDAVLEVGGGAPRDRAAFETQLRLGTSRDVLLRTTALLQLDENPDFNPAPPQPERESRTGPLGAIAGAGATAAEWLSGFAATASPAFEDGGGAGRSDASDLSRFLRSDEQNLNLAARSLARNVNALRAGRSQTTNIDYCSTDPVQAAEIANGIARSYIAEFGDQTAQTSREADRLLGERLETLGEQAREAERRIERFRSANQLGSGAGESFAEQRLARLGEQLIDARAEASEKEARVRFIRSLIQRGEGLDSVEEAPNSTAFQNLRAQEREILREIATLSIELGARHPRIAALQAEIEEIRDKVLQEAAFVASNVETEARIARSKIIQIEQAKSEAAVGQDATVDLIDLQRDADAVRRVYETFLSRAAELQGRGEMEAASTKIVTPAPPLEDPSSRAPMLYVAIGFVLAGGGFFSDGGCGREGERSHRQTEFVLRRISALHSINLSPHLLSSEREPPRALAVPSTTPGEGKSTFASSLALSAARMNLKVLLVDGDFRRPTVAAKFGLEPRAGLLEFQNDNAEIQYVVEHVEELGLDAIVGSTKTDRSIELVTVSSLSDFITAAKAAYDLVVFDSPPALGLADINIVASTVDDVFYVVQWNAAELLGAKSGLSALRSVDANIVGLVMSKIDMKRQQMCNHQDFSNYCDKYKKIT